MLDSHLDQAFKAGDTEQGRGATVRGNRTEEEASSLHGLLPGRRGARKSVDPPMYDKPAPGP